MVTFIYLIPDLITMFKFFKPNTSKLLQKSKQSSGSKTTTIDDGLIKGKHYANKSLYKFSSMGYYGKKNNDKKV